MFKTTKFYTLLFCFCFSPLALGEDDNTKKATPPEPQNMHSQYVKNITEEYKLFLGTVRPEVREEIVKYRKAISNLNNKKREIYRKLSQEAQSYLVTEQQFKEKLAQEPKATPATPAATPTKGKESSKEEVKK